MRSSNLSTTLHRALRRFEETVAPAPGDPLAREMAAGEPAGGRAGGAPAARVEFLGPPMTPERWKTYEETWHSYACTREFLEFFDDPSDAILAQVGPANGGVRAAFLYRCQGDTAHVLGRFFAPSAEDLAAFASAVFGRHPGVARIRTDFVDALPRPSALGRPVLVVREGIELRIALPRTVEEYERLLAPKLLGRMQYHRRRLARRHPETRLETVGGSAIPRAWIADVVQLNRERRSSKGGVSVFDPRYEQGIAAVARAHGQVTVLRDGERICAGVINVAIGLDAYFWVIGHSAAYDRFTPGLLCLLESIRRCIADGVKTFHLLHGESEYKRAVGGEPARLASYLVLRSWRAVRPGDVQVVVVTRAAGLARGTIRVVDRLAGRLPFVPEAPFASLARRWLRLARARPGR